MISIELQKVFIDIFNVEITDYDGDKEAEMTIPQLTPADMRKLVDATEQSSIAMYYYVVGCTDTGGVIIRIQET